MKESLLFVIILAITTVTFAIPPGLWQCFALDAQQRNFSANGNSLLEAQLAALKSCKNQSEKPKSCQSAQSFCEQGPLSLHEDRCLVTDNAGHSWDTNGVDACKTAIDMCNQFLYLQGGPRGQCSIKHGN